MPETETTTRTRSFRFGPSSSERLKELTEHWGAETENEALELSILFAYELSGLARANANSAMDALARVYGDDAPLTATVTEDWPNSIVTINGEPVEGWTAALVGVERWVTKSGQPVEAFFTREGEAVKPPRPGVMTVRHDASATWFGFGPMGDTEPGASVSVRVGDLVEHIVLRTEGKNPANLRKSIKRDLALRRKLRAARAGVDFDDNDTESEGMPLDDD